MARKNSAVWIPFISMALGSACGETSNERAVEATGQASIGLTRAPADAACLRVAVEGSKRIEKSFDLSEGEDTSLTLKGLPLGLAAFTASAYDARCTDLAPDADPTWISGAVEAEISVHDVAHVLLTMRRRQGQAVVDVDFAEDGGATFSHRLDVFLFDDLQFCISGEPCPTLEPDAACFRIYDAAGNVAQAFDQATVRTLEPEEPVPPEPNGTCIRVTLDQEERREAREQIEQFRDEVAEYTRGALDLELVWHEYMAPIRLAAGSSGGAFSIGPLSMDELAESVLTSDTDFVIVTNGARDRDTGMYIDVPACGFSYSFDQSLAGAGFSWLPKTRKAFGFECAMSLVYMHEWLHQVEDGLHRLSPYDDLYDGVYPACGQGDPEPTKWFPNTHDWYLDPDFPGCGTDGYPRFEEHQLRVHWSADNVLITNHCKDGVQDFDEQGVDVGGRCRW